MISCNSDGSEKLKPMILGKVNKPRCFKNFQYSHYVDYRSSSKGWMDSCIFKDWLIQFDRAMMFKNRKVALLLDNAPSHKTSATLNNVELIFIPPNMTCHLLPLDAGIIHSLKSAYRKNIVKFAMI